MPRIGSGVPFVARGVEIGQLRAALQRANAGTAGAVLVAGDAGVGKSRLLAELTAQAAAQGAEVLLGRCLSVGEAGLPYLPFKEVIEELLARHDDVVTSRPSLTSLIGRVGPPAAPAAEETELGQLRLFDAVLGALVELTADTCVVLAVEDLHWSDASTRDLLAFLLSRLSTQRLLIVATYRSDDLHRRHPLRPLLAELVRLPAVERLDLAPFDADDALAFVRALADGVVDAALVADVAARSEGNAFFAEELFAASSSPHGGIPTALADVLMSRVETSSPPAQRVVGAISATGREHVRHSTLRAVLDIDEAELDAALREALQHHILVTDADDAYMFRHALLREAVYADLLPGERVRLHAAYAQQIRALKQANLAGALAYHSLRSNDLPTALAASVRAADDAMHVGALAAELRHVEQALELWQAVDDPESHAGVDELALIRKAAYVASAAGHPERALAYAQAAVPLVDDRGDPVARADVRRQLTETLLANNRVAEARHTIAEAWDLVMDMPPSRVRAWVLALRARTSDETDDDARRAFAEQAVADARVCGAASAEADALISLAFTETRTGSIEQACGLLEQARDRAAQAGAPNVELRALFNLATTRMEQGLLDLASAIADEGAERASEVGLTWSMYGLELRWMQVMVHYARGSWDEALAASSPPGEQVSDTVSALLAAAGAIVKVGLGRFDEAEHELVKLHPEWHRDSQIAQLAGIAGVEMATLRGQTEAATALVDEALTSMRKHSGSPWPLGGIRLATLGLGVLADCAHQARASGDHQAETGAVAAGERFADYARQTAENGVPRADTMGPEGRAWLARMRAEEGRLHGSLDPMPWREVIEAFGYGEVYHVAMARWRLAELLVSAGDRDGAAAELAATLQTASGLHAQPLADAARGLARRAHIAVPGAILPASSALTPRERTVLELVARGYTNRKVGQELFISEKTVSVHMSRVMTKLAAASRTEAVAVAYQRGLLDAPG